MKPPFSRRSGGPKQWIEDEWPQSARTVLLHLLHDLVDRDYVDGWISVDKEVRRIAREAPLAYNHDHVASIEEARVSVEIILANLHWSKMFDFCERLYLHLATGVQRWDSYINDWKPTTSREDVQPYIADELQRIFLEEHFAYSFVLGEVRRRGRNHTRELAAKAEPTLGDPRLSSARQHYGKALQYFEHPSRPDYENAVKEAVCAVEAAARRLFPGTQAKTLGEVVKRIQGSGKGQLPKPLADTLTGLYAFRNAGDGVSHGGADGGKATPAVAEYVLALAASQVILLHEIASAAESEVPF